MTKSNSELEACRWCGSDELPMLGIWGFDSKYAVVCFHKSGVVGGTGAKATSGEFATKSEAIKAWNTRSPKNNSRQTSDTTSDKSEVSEAVKEIFVSVDKAIEEGSEIRPFGLGAVAHNEDILRCQKEVTAVLQNLSPSKSEASVEEAVEVLERAIKILTDTPRRLLDLDLVVDKLRSILTSLSPSKDTVKGEEICNACGKGVKPESEVSWRCSCGCETMKGE